MGKRGVAMDDNQKSETTAADTESSDAVIEELLVEEVSIDGMCGVY
jgi:mycofactocin precursor